MQTAKKLAFVLLSTALFFLVLETGFRIHRIRVEYGDWIRSAQRATDAPERLFCAYDPAIGWTNKPGSRVPDVYSAGSNVTINNLGLRSTSDTVAAKPQQRTRVLCLGDSFTFGHGVGDGWDWPGALGKLDAAYDVLNAGVCAYGLDQAYLAYRLQWSALKPDAVVLGLVIDDVYRMRLTRWKSGYGRPRINFDPATHLIANYPVPKPIGAGRPMIETADKMQFLMRQSATFRTVGGWMQRQQAARSEKESSDEVWSLAGRIVQQLRTQVDEQGGRLLIVVIPHDLAWHENQPIAHEKMLREAKAGQWPLVDLTAPIAQQAKKDGKNPFWIDGFHLNAYGNSLVAGFVHRVLNEIL